jgi:hypothetical protein
LRPVSRRQIDVINVADLRKLLHVHISLLNQLLKHRARDSHEMTVIGTS